ncbi:MULTISPECIES: hypothetical protein [Desertifilum]|nr:MULTISPECIES: hypothetical protein [Desertifilum]
MSASQAKSIVPNPTLPGLTALALSMLAGVLGSAECKVLSAEWV